MPRQTPDGPSIYPNCGTKTGYDRHLRNGTPTCRKCKDRVAADLRKWRHETGRNKARLIDDHIIHKHGLKVNT